MDVGQNKAEQEKSMRMRCKQTGRTLWRVAD